MTQIPKDVTFGWLIQNHHDNVSNIAELITNGTLQALKRIKFKGNKRLEKL